MPTRLQRLASVAVCAYLRHAPVQAGKWRLMRWTSSFLVVELARGTYIRISNPEDSVEAAIVRKGLLEPEDVRFFLGLLGPGMTVFDVGANLGMYSLLAVRRVGPAGRLHAFEPTPAVADRLHRNVLLNGLTNVVINRAAVSDTAGVATFYLREGSDRNTLGAGRGTPIQVPTVTLDDHAAAHAPGGVDVLKMDVEGAEVMALRGGRRLLGGDSAPVILIEFNAAALRDTGVSVPELRRLLEEHGYRCSTLRPFRGENCYNVVAYKPLHRDRFPALRAAELIPLP